MFDRTITIVLCSGLPVETITILSGFLERRLLYRRSVSKESKE